MGPTRLLLAKPVIAVVEATPSPAALSSRCGATCGSPTPPWRSGVQPVMGVPLIDGGTVRLPRLVGSATHWT